MIYSTKRCNDATKVLLVSDKVSVEFPVVPAIQIVKSFEITERLAALSDEEIKTICLLNTEETLRGLRSRAREVLR